MWICFKRRYTIRYTSFPGEFLLEEMVLPKVLSIVYMRCIEILSQDLVTCLSLEIKADYLKISAFGLYGLYYMPFLTTFSDMWSNWLIASWHIWISFGVDSQKQGISHSFVDFKIEVYNMFLPAVSLEALNILVLSNF